MKSILIFSLLFVFVLCGVIDLQAQTGAARGKAFLKGKVKDNQGTPLEDVTVHFVSDERKTSFDVKTDKDGKWSAPGIAGGAWNIDFVKEGYQVKKISTKASEVSFNKAIEITMDKAVVVQEQKVAGLDVVQEASKLRDNKDYAGAIAKYEQALQANPNLVALYGEIGRTYLLLDQPDKALEAYMKLIEKQPTNLQARIDAATVLLQKGNVPEAMKIVADLDLAAITDSDALYNLGALFYNAKEIEAAIKYWERTIALNPKNVDAHLQLGFAYFAQNQVDKAKQEFQKVIELDPGSENAKAAQEMMDSMT